MSAHEYTMEETSEVARKASLEIEIWLLSLSETIHVRNVEDDPLYRRIDVDLLWYNQYGPYKVEIKADRYYQTGNLFFETYSNWESGTPGCFLYTEADYLFYYFPTIRKLYILPMPKTRYWFQSNADRFRERSTRTPTRTGFYTTVGRLVPIETVLQEVSGIRVVQLQT